MGSFEQAVTDPIGAVLFGATRQAVLRLLFSHNDQRFYQRQIINLLGSGSGAVQRELEQLTAAGILTRTVEGRQSYYQANPASPVFEELRSLIRKTFGVVSLLRAGLSSLADRIAVAFIYGSVAAGTERASSDIDVMIVGTDLSLQDIVSAFSKAQRDTGREVNPSVYEVEEFRRKLAEGHHFVCSVAEGPKLFLVGDKGDFTRLAQARVAAPAQDEPPGDRRPVRRR